jgi:outer membrane lipoprotein-sorting protein
MRALSLPRKRTTAGVTAVCIVGAFVLLLFRADPSPALRRIRPASLLSSSMRALQQPYSVSGRLAADVNVSRRHHRSDHGGGTLTHSVFRVWRSAAGLRLAQVLPFGERLVVANPDETWYWDSESLIARQLPATDATSSGLDFTPTLAPDPFALARSILGTVAPYSRVQVLDTGTVAGRSVYLLSLRSVQRHTRLHKVILSVDAVTRLPLEISIYTHKLAAPAVDIAFTSISFAPIDAAVFRFNPPRAATVLSVDPFAGGRRTQGPMAAETRTFGRGWKTRIAWRLSHRLSRDAASLFPMWNAIGSTLTVRAHGKSWVLAGFVSLSRLEDDVSKLP